MLKFNEREFQDRFNKKKCTHFTFSSLDQTNSPTCINYTATFTSLEIKPEESVMIFTSDFSRFSLCDIVSVTTKDEVWGIEIKIVCNNYQDGERNCNTYTFVAR